LYTKLTEHSPPPTHTKGEKRTPCTVFGPREKASNFELHLESQNK